MRFPCRYEPLRRVLTVIIVGHESLHCEMGVLLPGLAAPSPQVCRLTHWGHEEHCQGTPVVSPWPIKYKLDAISQPTHQRLPP